MINRYAEQGCQMNIEWVSGEAPVKLAVVTGIWKMVQEVITRPGPTDARLNKIPIKLFHCSKSALAAIPEYWEDFSVLEVNQNRRSQKRLILKKKDPSWKKGSGS